MTIGIIGAMDEEIELLKQKINTKKEEQIAGCSIVLGELYDQEIVLLKSGIGKVNASMATTILHERYNISQVINTGSAGGFAEQLDVGDVVISTHVTHHDVDVTAFNYAYGQVPGMPAMYEADAGLIKQASYAVNNLGETQALKGIIATGDSFMHDQDRVNVVREKFPTMLASEMEAAAVAQVCYQYNTPFVIIRALSDIAGIESSVSFDAFLDKAAKNAATIILNMVK